MIKQREESEKIYADAGRVELAKQEAEEIVIIREFLPKQLSAADMDQAIAAAIEKSGAASIKDMGRGDGRAESRLCRPNGLRQSERRGEGEARLILIAQIVGATITPRAQSRAI